MDKIVHFEIQAEDLQRASDFYSKIFGWRFEKRNNETIEYWMIYASEKDSEVQWISGWLLKRPSKTPPMECWTNSYVCTILVDNFDETASKILSLWGIVAMPKFALPWMAWQWYFLDTEWNTFWIHQPDVNAQ